MFNEFFEGYCPECRLAEKSNKLVLNGSDFFACPDCGLQVCLYGELFIIILHRRNSTFLKTYSGDTINEIANPTGRAMSELSQDEHGNYSNQLRPSKIITTEEELRTYLGRIQPR